MKEEIWTDIDTFKGNYQISNFFRVRSLDRVVKMGRFESAYRTIKGKILKPHIFPNGYVYYKLFLNQKQKNEMAHVLIAKYFIPNPENKPCVNHINGIKHDNRIENLEWATHSENLLHSFRVLKRKPSKAMLGRKNELSVSSKKINKLSICGSLIKTYPSISEAARDLGNENKKGNILTALKNNNRSSYGYKWEYC